MKKLEYSYNDGGRSKYFKGNAGDCVVRALAIWSGENYKELYNSLRGFIKKLKSSGIKTKSHPRNGINPKILKLFLKEKGFKYSYVKELKQINMLGNGNFLLNLDGHIVTVKNGILYDTWDSREQSKWSGYYVEYFKLI
jgi:hypothetical protein